MRNILIFLAVLALAGGLAACNKDKGPEGPTDFSGGCEAVDLGLSVKWASYNVGAKAPEEYGSYFAWGETKEKSNYGWSKVGDYKWGVYDESASPLYGMTKYTADIEGGDGLKTLQPGDDAATANWGTKWRTPTFKEIVDLLDVTKCEWTWDATKKGYTVKGLATGNSIFLPTAGWRDGSNLNDTGTYGLYWLSEVRDEGEFAPHAAEMLYIREFFGGYPNGCLRYRGISVRAVTEY